MNKVTATVQARLGSSRLPGKCLMPVLDKPLLQHMIERIRASRLVDQVVIATTTSELDDSLERFGNDIGVDVFRGAEDDVLGRICACLEAFEVDTHVEMLGDSPLPCPHLIDEVLGYYFKHAGRYDFVSNDLEETYPAGLEVKVYPARTLLEVGAKIPATDPTREHVSYHIKNRPEHFRLKNLQAPARLRRPDVFLEVDEQADFEFVANVIEYFGSDNLFSLSQIIEFLEANPELAAHNQHVYRRWQHVDHEH